MNLNEPRPIRIERKHIDAGTPGNECECAVALAVAEAYGIPLDEPEGSGRFAFITGDVDDGIQVVVDDDTTVYFDLWESVRCFIASYDNEEPVEPFEFTPRTVTVRTH